MTASWMVEAARQPEQYGQMAANANPPALAGEGNSAVKTDAIWRSSFGGGGTHERADVFGPLRVERGIGTGAQPHHFAGIVFVGIEVPGSRLDLERGDLVLPAILAERRLIFCGRGRQALEVGLRVDQQLATSRGRCTRLGRCHGRLVSRADASGRRRGRWRRFLHWLLRYRDRRDGAITLRRIRYALIFAAAVFGRHRHPAQPGAVFGVTGATGLRHRNIAVGIVRVVVIHERAERDERDQRTPPIIDEDPAAVAVDADATPSVGLGKLAGLIPGSLGQADLAGLISGSLGQADLAGLIPWSLGQADFAGLIPRSLGQADFTGLILRSFGQADFAGLIPWSLGQADFVGLAAGYLRQSLFATRHLRQGLVAAWYVRQGFVATRYVRHSLRADRCDWLGRFHNAAGRRSRMRNAAGRRSRMRNAARHGRARNAAHHWRAAHRRCSDDIWLLLLSSETYRTARVLRCRRGLCERTRRCLHRRRDRQSRNQDDEPTHVRPLFFFRFPPDPLRERERQNVMDAFDRLYRFYSLNMTCIKLALLSHPLWIGCESKIGAIFAFSMAK